MNLFETLKEFKNISPDPAYTEKSKRAILAVTPKESLSFRRVFAHIFETGVAVALTVFFILIIVGQFSNTPYVSPAQFSVINPATLRAEAQAVDIQIQLAKVAYQEPTSTTTETTAQRATSGAVAFPMKIADSAATPSSSVSAVGSQGSSTVTSTVVSVDEALNALSQ
jgi:hypothetical protein